MIIGTVMSVLIGCAIAQFQSTATNDPQHSSRNDIFYQVAPIHFVDIGPKLDGDYKFAYNTGKGPMGQSYREETRLADGTVKGSYGVTDESGHKRIVHYYTGQGNSILLTDSKSTVTPTTQRHSKVMMHQNLNMFPLQQPIFKPANYLQSRTTQPVNIEPIRLTPQKKLVLKKVKADMQLQKAMKAANKHSAPAERANIIQPVTKSTMPTSTEQVTVPTTQRSTMSQQQQDSITALAEMYSSLKRVPKTTSLPKHLPIIEYRTNKADEKIYEYATGDDYYDSSPAFIDIGRLSYSIGADKSSSL